MRTTIGTLLITFAATLFGAAGDVPLSPLLQAQLPGVGKVAIGTSEMEYLIAFTSDGRIYWQRAAIDGTPLDARAQILEDATPDGFEYPQEIETVWTGETYFILWNQDGAVVAQAIDRNGVVTPRFTVVSGMVLRDAARSGPEVAVLSMAGTTHRLTLLNPYGARLGGASFSSTAADLAIVHLDEGWVAAGHPSLFGLTIVNPQTGASREVAPAFRFGALHASPGGGAFAVSSDGSVGVLRRNGEFVRLPWERPIDSLLFDPVVLVSPTLEGWAVLYRSEGEARIANVRNDGAIGADRPLSGPFPSSASSRSPYFAAASAREDNHLLIQPAPFGTTLGLESIAVSGALSFATGTYAIGDAVQKWGRTAHGPGVDLVVWLESGYQGWDIRATRVQEGNPLDGEGIVLASGFPSSLEAIFDGENFAVVWSDRDGIFVRRLDLHATVIDGAPILVSAAAAQQVIVAASGDGALLVGWQEPEAEAAIVRGGRLRSSVSVGRGASTDEMEAGGNRTSFLAVLAEPEHMCNISPCQIGRLPVAVRLLTPEGTPVGDPVPISAPMAVSAVGKPVAHGGEWFVPILKRGDARVVRLPGSASFVIARVPTIEGRLRSAAGGIEILGPAFRGLLSSDPENVWYEPLPLEPGDVAEGAMDASDTLLVDTGTRFVLRPIASPTVTADIAVVHRQRSVQGDYSLDGVAIEHRAGDPVSALQVEVRNGTVVSSSRPIVNGRIEGPFEQGETIELMVSGLRLEERVVSGLPFARETAAADNFLVIPAEVPPPPPKRRRLVGRP